MRRFSLGLGVIVGLALLAPRAGAAAIAPLPVTFSRVAHAEPSVQTSQSGRYAFLTAAPGGATLGWLIDSGTGRRRGVGDACPANVYGRRPLTTLGDGWLVVQCPGNSRSLELIAVATGNAHVLAVTDRDCLLSYTLCSFDSVGSRWMTVSPGCVAYQHCEFDDVAENLVTGQLSDQDFDRPHERVDLDSPTLHARICSPLSDTASSEVMEPLSARIGPFAVLDEGSAPYQLRRCGSRFRRLVYGTPVAANRHLLIYETGDQHHLFGYFLPSLRRFSIAIPRAAEIDPSARAEFPGVALTESTLYLFAAGAKEPLIAARLPTHPEPRDR